MAGRSFLTTLAKSPPSSGLGPLTCQEGEGFRHLGPVSTCMTRENPQSLGLLPLPEMNLKVISRL